MLYNTISLNLKQHPVTESRIFYAPFMAASEAYLRLTRSALSLGVLANGNVPAALSGERAPTFFKGVFQFSNLMEAIMPKNSNAQRGNVTELQSQFKATPKRNKKPSLTKHKKRTIKALDALTKELLRIDKVINQQDAAPRNPIIDGRESSSIHGVASLELTCFDCTEHTLLDRREAIIHSLRHIAAISRGIFELDAYQPLRRPIESFATLVEPVSFGVIIDVVVLNDDDIVALADEIMAKLVDNFKRVGNAQGGAK